MFGKRKTVLCAPINPSAADGTSDVQDYVSNLWIGNASSRFDSALDTIAVHCTYFRSLLHCPPLNLN